MKQILSDYIKENEALRKLLLAQEGGIMKYLAEHLDANGTAELFSGYQEHCVDIFFEKNKWDLRVVWEGDDMRRAALGESEHLWRELRYQRNLKPLLADIPTEVAEEIDLFTEQYLTYAYNKYRQLRFPDGITPRDIYRELVGMYGSLGLAYKSMEFILREHHTNGKIEKTESDLLTEFLIRQYSGQLTLGLFAKLRQAVAEMFMRKDPKFYRQMAIDTMEKVRIFSQKIYTKEIVRALRALNSEDYNKEADKRESDGEWLREQAYRGTLEVFSDHIKTHSMRYYFADFVNILKELGRIWAAQLLVHKIDMRDLEEEVACIMNTENTPRYYVDKHYIDDLPDLYCVSNDRHAEKLLKEMGRKLEQKCYLKLANENAESEDKGKLYRAYNILVEEGFIDDKKTPLITFTDVFINNVDKDIYWINDPTRKYLKELILVFLGLSNKYSYPAIFEVSDKGKQWAFVKQHFVDENSNEIEIKSNSTKLGKKDKNQFERILKAIYFYISNSKEQKRT
jgi:hypothetical protein